MGRLFCLRVLGAEEASQNNLYLPSSQSITHLPSLCYWATGPMWLIYSAVQFISSSILARRMQSGSGFMPNFWSPIHSFSEYRDTDSFGITGGFRPTYFCFLHARRVHSDGGFMPNFWSPIHAFSGAGGR